MDAQTHADLSRIYAAINHMMGLEGQDRSLVIEMSQAMLNDIIETDGLAPMADYVARYCDVLDVPGDAERIAAAI
jgi:hypothetical protein